MIGLGVTRSETVLTFVEQMGLQGSNSATVPGTSQPGADRLIDRYLTSAVLGGNSP